MNNPYLVFHTYINNKINVIKRMCGKRRTSYRLFFIDHTRKLIYIENPKAASRTILASFETAHLSGNACIISSVSRPHLAISLPSIKGWVPHLYIFSWRGLTHETRDWLTKKEINSYDTFTFVRDPFDRAVSGFTNKIISATPIRVPPKTNKRTWKEFLEIQDTDYDIPKAFEAYVKKYLCVFSDSQIDVHFKSQSALTTKVIPVPITFVGHIETLKTDWEFLQKKYNVPPLIDVKLNQSENRHPYETYITNKEILELLYKRYKKDIHNFGYTITYEALRKKYN